MDTPLLFIWLFTNTFVKFTVSVSGPLSLGSLPAIGGREDAVAHQDLAHTTRHCPAVRVPLRQDCVQSSKDQSVGVPDKVEGS